MLVIIEKEIPPLIGPAMLEVIDRITSGLDHARSEYYEEFREIFLNQARFAVEHGDPQEAVNHANCSLDLLSRWAFSNPPGATASRQQ